MCVCGVCVSRVKGALQLRINRYESIRFAQVPERISTKSFVVLIIGNSKSNHVGAQGTFNPQSPNLGVMVLRGHPPVSSISGICMYRWGVLALHVEYAEPGKECGFLFMVSLFCESMYFHMFVSMSYTGLTRRNTLIIFVWLRHRNT